MSRKTLVETDADTGFPGGRAWQAKCACGRSWSIEVALEPSSLLERLATLEGLLAGRVAAADAQAAFQDIARFVSDGLVKARYGEHLMSEGQCEQCGGNAVDLLTQLGCSAVD